VERLPMRLKPKILLVAHPQSVGIVGTVEFCFQLISKRYGGDPVLSVAYTGGDTPNACMIEDQLIQERKFAEAWFLGDRLSVPVLRTFSLLLESNCRMRSGALANSPLFSFLHDTNGLPIEV
jgi:hypothetical protein